MTVDEKQRRTERKREPLQQYPVIAPGTTFHSVTEQISSIVLTRPAPLFWYAAFGTGHTASSFFQK